MAFDFNKLQPLETGIPGQNVKTPGFNFDNLPEVGAPAPEPVKQPGFIQSVVQDIAKPFLKTAVTPVAIVKSAAQLAAGKAPEAQESLTKEYDFGYFGKVKPLGADIAPTASAGEVLRKGGKEVLGTALEIGSNLVGGGGAAGVGKSLLKSQLRKAIVSSGKTGLKIGALGAGGRALQEDQSLGNIAAETAIGAGIGAVTGAGLGIAGVGAKALATPLSTVTQKIVPALESMAGKIETTVLKPVKSDFQGGFKAENVLRYDLGGTVKDTIEKATAKLKQLRTEANALRAGSTKAIDLNKIVQDTAAEISTNRMGGFGVNKNMETAFSNFVKEMEYITKDGKLTVPQAQEVKEALGTFGSWLYGAKDLDATAQERVANILYSKVKTAIEKNTPGELQGINRQMADIIPIKNAAIRRLPVAERNNAIGLNDIISAGVALQNPTGWGLLVLNQLQKSGRFAQKVYRGAGALKTGVEKIQNKIPGLRITPENLINRNTQLRKSAIKAEEVIATKNPVANVAKPTTKYASAYEAMNSPEKIKFFKKVNEQKAKGNVTKTSNNLYHTTPAENIENITKKGLTTGNKPRFEGVSSPNKISFGANEKTASYYGGPNDVLLRTKAGYKPDDLNLDLLAGGEGAYTTGKNIPPEFLEIKVGSKWIPLNEYKNTTTPKLRTTTGAEELAFQRAPKLTKKDRETETKAIKKFVRNKEKMINDYIAENGKVANADEARKLFSDVGYKGYNSAAVQEPASALNKEVFRKLLKDNPEPYVTIYSGGSGAGKSSAIKGQKRIKAAETKSAAILDGNLSSLKSAIDRLKEVTAAGKKAKFVYVYRDPIDAFENGVVKRMKFNKAEAGRIVPAKVVAGNHKDSLDVIKALYENSPEKLKKNFTFLDNSQGKGKVKKMTYEELLKKQIPSDLEKQLINKSKELYAKGEINKRELAKYIE